MSEVEQPTAKWICDRCAKVVSSRPFGRCADCNGVFRRATERDLQCDRCGAVESKRLADRQRWDRLCDDCISEVSPNA